MGSGIGGVLATWARGKFPHLFRGAVAVNAPLVAKDSLFEVPFSQSMNTCAVLCTVPVPLWSAWSVYPGLEVALSAVRLANRLVVPLVG
jgi:serine carboxypeptidase S28